MNASPAARAALIALLVVVAASGQDRGPAAVGEFEDHADVGAPRLAGSAQRPVVVAGTGA